MRVLTVTYQSFFAMYNCSNRAYMYLLFGCSVFLRNFTQQRGKKDKHANALFNDMISLRTKIFNDSI